MLRHRISKRIADLEDLRVALQLQDQLYWPPKTPVSIKLAFAGVNADLADVIDHHQAKLRAAYEATYRL